MIAYLVWTIRAWRWRLVGAWERRRMRRQAGGYTDPPRQPPPPAPRIIVVTAPPARETVRVNLGERVVELNEDRIAYLALMRRREQEEPTI